MARANISGVIAGLSDKSISSSFIAFNRAQSVRDFLEVADFFIMCCLSDGDDSNYFVGFSMSNDYHVLLEQCESDKAFFPVIEAVVSDCNRRTLEGRFDTNKINTVFDNVGLTFSFIPLKSHL
jgi:hypothetical protein